MAVTVIDTIKPKNNGTFPVVEAVDVKVTASQRLDAALNAKANQSDFNSLSTTVSGKASQSDLNALSDTVASKASQSALNATNAAVALKASQADLTALETEVDTKAEASDITNLQAQIDNIVTPVTQDAEVQNARVGEDGKSYVSLKSRLDSEYKKLDSVGQSLAEYGAITYSPNMLDEYHLNNGAIMSNTGEYVDAQTNPTFADWWTSDYIKIEAGDKYVFSKNGTAKDPNSYAVYNASKEYVGTGYFTGGVATMPNTGAYIRLSIAYLNLDTNNYQFEKGETPTPHVDYGEVDTDFSEVEIGVDRDRINYITHEINELVESDNLPGLYMENGYHANGPDYKDYVTKVFNVSDIDTVYLSGVISAYCSVVTMNKNKEVIREFHKTEDYTYTNFKRDVSNSERICVSSKYSNFWGDSRIKLTADKRIDGRWKNKKIVWFGTSIPAGGYKGNANDTGYPYLVGRKLGATVYNEAVGTSCMHSKQYNRISATNPYGFRSAFEPASRALCNTVEEMQWIANWADYYCNGGTYANECEWDPNVFTSQLPSSWNESNTADIISFSYENKLDQYFTSAAFPDLFVIDHGYNDNLTYSDDMNYYEDQYETYGRYNMYTFRGAMNFIIDRILSYNPKVKIVLIGNYDKTLEAKKDVAKYQAIVADDNQIPLLKLWEKTMFTQSPISLRGRWSTNRVWYENANPQSFTKMNSYLADGVHPHSDRSGWAIRYLADIITPFIENC